MLDKDNNKTVMIGNQRLLKQSVAAFTNKIDRNP